jgi:Domain of unknown function (DUF4399)
MRYLVLWLLSVAATLATPASAAPLPADALARECWLSHTRERTRVNLREPTAVDFANLVRGFRVRSPFQVDFAVRGMGVAPAGKALQGTGHHHILINTPLPVDIRAQIPFSDTHKHFGKGQTGTVLDLPPGTHRLRLLFADHEHRPYFVFSPEIEITVTGPRDARPLPIDRRNFEASCLAWYQDELARPRPPGELVTILNLRNGEVVTSPFNLRFGVDGFGVCAAGQTAERTGYFILEVRQGGRLVRVIDLANGATQSNLSLPDGAYQLALRFVDGRTRRDLLPAYEAEVFVAGQERL